MSFTVCASPTISGMANSWPSPTTATDRVYWPPLYPWYLDLVGRRPTDSILVVVSSDGAYPELMRGFVSSQLLALGYVPAPDRNGRRFESLKTEVVAFRHRNAGAFR